MNPHYFLSGSGSSFFTHFVKNYLMKSFLQLKKQIRLLKSKKQQSRSKFTSKFLIKLQLLLISLYFFCCSFSMCPSWIRIQEENECGFMRILIHRPEENNTFFLPADEFGYYFLVLWCYKKELGFSSHRKKKMKQLQKKIKSGKLDVNEDDPFELFIASTNIRYAYYHETHKILGRRSACTT